VYTFLMSPMRATFSTVSSSLTWSP
jgi:hypothetical protein